jgi:hypothetical protein
MKIIKFEVDGQIKINSIYDTDTKIETSGNSSLKIPYRKL